MCFQLLVLVVRFRYEFWRSRIRFWWVSSGWIGPWRRCSRRPQTGTTRCSSVVHPAGSGPGRSGRRGLSSGCVRLCVPGLDWSRSCCCTRPPRGWRGSGSSPWTTWTNDSNRTDCEVISVMTQHHILLSPHPLCEQSCLINVVEEKTQYFPQSVAWTQNTQVEYKYLRFVLH